ncbi:MAG: ArsA family ATPase [Thermoleophilaceae bacterium]|nr:ArsA family ATPase [Thermoleophilaceae bacterium]
MIERVLDGRTVCICAGSGGVGKTTTAAAIGLGMAARGRRVAVLTIDPARRLADALGLTELGNEARLVDAGAEGELWALTLDAKRTFDELVELHAPDAATRDAVLGNRIYQELSRAVAGSQEYMAMEKLYDLHHEGGFDLLVLDTPPTRSALDFLDAPADLTAFIDSRTFRVLTAPTRFGMRLFGRGGGLALSALERATGVRLLQDLSEFFTSFGTMSEGFRRRADAVDRLLAGDDTSFVLVTAPRRDAVEEAIFFRERLDEAGMPFGGVVANRVHAIPAEATAAGLAGPLGEELARRVEADLGDQRRLSERDRRTLAALRRLLSGRPMIQIPELDRDVHDLDGLRALEPHLFGGAA